MEQDNTYHWKVLEKSYSPETFFNYGFAIYVVENVSSKEREVIETQHKEFVVGDVISCMPRISQPSLVNRKE